MSAHLDSYVKSWNRIHKQTTHIMAVAPDGQYDWKPAESSMTLGALMNHLWIAEWGLVEAALTGSLPKEGRPTAINSTAELLAAFDKSHEELIPRVTALTPEQLAETVAPFGAERALTRMALLNVLHEHEIHHRGQLYVYLRMLGCEIPPLFG
jgi:uncharacterized damage-inducible protein DinB